MYVYDFECLTGQKIMTLADTAASPIAANTQGVLVAGPAAILESGQFFCEVKLMQKCLSQYVQLDFLGILGADELYFKVHG